MSSVHFKNMKYICCATSEAGRLRFADDPAVLPWQGVAQPQLFMQLLLLCVNVKNRNILKL